MAQIQGTLFDQINDTPRCSYNNLGSALERANLRSVCGTTVDRDNIDIATMRSKIRNCLCGLHSQLTRGGKNKCLHMAFI